MTRAEFGAHLREARLRAGLFQEPIAKLVGVSQEAVSAIERGANRPRRSVLAGLLLALGLAGTSLGDELLQARDDDALWAPPREPVADRVIGKFCLDLREARIQAGLSQRALARKARTNQSDISKIEQGRTRPSHDVLVRLLRALDLDGTDRGNELIQIRDDGPWSRRERTHLTCRGVTAEDVGALPEDLEPGYHSDACRGHWDGWESAARALATRSGDSYVCAPCWREVARLKAADAAACRVELGRQVRGVRLHAGLRQREVAGPVGVSVSMVSKIEHGSAGPGPEVAAKLVAASGVDTTSPMGVRHLVLSYAGIPRGVSRAPFDPPVRLTCRGVTRDDLRRAGYEPQPWLNEPHHAPSCKREWIGSESAARKVVTRRDDTFVSKECGGEMLFLKGERRMREATGARSTRSRKELRDLQKTIAVEDRGAERLRDVYGYPAAPRRGRTGRQGWVDRWVRGKVHGGVCPCGTLLFQSYSDRQRIGRPLRSHKACQHLVEDVRRRGRPWSEEAVTRNFGWAVRHHLGGISLGELARQDGYKDVAVANGVRAVMERLPEPSLVARRWRPYIEGLQAVRVNPMASVSDAP